MKRISALILLLIVLPLLLAATAISVNAPPDATYITQTANGVLSGEQALSSLSTGLMRVTTTTGAITTATAGTHYYVSGSTTSPGMIVGLYGLTASTVSPSDSTTYYFGAPCAMTAAAQQLTTTAGRRRFYFPTAGTITKAYITVINEGGTAGTSETSSLFLQVNGSDTDTLSSAITTAATGVFSNTSLSRAISAGDYVEIRWATPAWATNPTNIQFSVQLEFHP